MSRSRAARGSAVALFVAVASVVGVAFVRKQPVSLRFRAVVGAEPFACGKSYEVAGVRVEPIDLRLFVHAIELVRDDGDLVPLALDPDGAFQTDEVALLDFEDGSAGCRNGTSALSTVVHGHAPRGRYTGVRFRIGVPFEQNHDNPDLAKPPLDLSAMAWSWNAGHTFLRFDVKADGRPRIFHLGSTGCEGTVGHIARCSRPNRPLVVAQELALDRGEIVFDLAPLITATLARASGDGCMSAPDDPDCAPLFAALGLDTATGESSSSAQGFAAR
jgi:uncharacterized repeat protein (TIGR04052 family)